MRVPRNLANKIGRVASRLIASGLNTEQVTLHWRVTTYPTGYISDLETTHAGLTVVEKSEVQPAFVHFVNIPTNGFIRHAEISIGDAILDFLGNVDLSSKPHLRYEFNGKMYVAKSSGTSLESSWDVRINGVPITKTVLVALVS